jgi:hypothetical protein
MVANCEKLLVAPLSRASPKAEGDMQLRERRAIKRGLEGVSNLKMH